MQTTQFFCTGCGYRLQAGVRFCTNCGKPVPAAAAVAVKGNGSLPPGLVLGGRWTIMKQLGKGAMGAVYMVQDNRLSNRRAALKEMLDRSETLGDRHQAIERFNREAETLAGLTHASIPHIYDRFTDEDRVYMVMEFVDGIDLEKLFYKFRDACGETLPERVVTRYAYQLAGVLEYLHRQSPPTLHRDLKPSNMVLQINGNLKLIDFGIARLFHPGSQGTGLGTQGYAAPEQYKGMAEPRTDIYALGATMHHMLTGRDPQLETPFDFPNVKELTPVSPPFAELIMAMLEMKPENRPSASEIKRRLSELNPGIHDWDEDPRVLQLLGARPRPVTRQLVHPSSSPSLPTGSAPSVPVPPVQAAASPLPVPALLAQAPAPSKFCTACGTRLIPGAVFCTGCGQRTAADSQPLPGADPAGHVAPSQAPVVSGSIEMSLRVPPHMHGTPPKEYVAFDDTAEPACVLGTIRQGGAEYVFVCPGPHVSTGALVEVYMQRWQGDQAVFEPVDRNTPGIAQDVDFAWRNLTAKL